MKTNWKRQTGRDRQGDTKSERQTGRGRQGDTDGKRRPVRDRERVDTDKQIDSQTDRFQISFISEITLHRKPRVEFIDMNFTFLLLFLYERHS